ncbi:hypothetical protein EV361DRAFT_803135 [Lentinula raphanica]|uniref:Long chronological lifespan protein 2 n=1 Tax=Lentinula raphanica TaxID=153919 RepID=A0AA38UJD8_9AGAR|nr:hypothetical protein C8R42DRAFT_667133 [Lentinula raphanica]KAJ3763206.1 hypothetical protein EV360DRAFT_34047 [Lentinula raphanica]KAJ3775487.1 hypothetical protein FB446DRAFT_725197 [Lentinula raphanica]KAJ3822441.1 hypothetical protein F5880DRAFT_1574733 [Lentinula raphanica]KAJ3840602.1 hypothetical protein F5878DRAFT_533354 [Lentinula raphanica]
MQKICTVFLALFWALSFASAQFSFFDQMFGHHGQQQQRQQQQQQSGGSHSQWASSVDSVSCSQYLCPTFDCVATPHDCPCPDQEDVKCIIPDADDKRVGTVICTRGPEACLAVEQLIWRLAGQQQRVPL